MPSRNSSRTRSHNGGIDKLDFDSQRRASSTLGESGRSSPNGLLRDDESFFEDVVDGVIERDRRKMRRMVIKYISFACSILSCLCAGSVTAYSVYGHLFLSRLRYTQSQVNLVAIAAGTCTYVLGTVVGYLCDRYSPRPVSLASAFLNCFGYLLAAFTYRKGPPVARGGEGWPVGVMIFAFVMIGTGTICMYMSALSTSAKNFGRSKYKGLAIALPVASLGLSGLWQSQVGSKLLCEPGPAGGKGDVDVFRFFGFLAGTLAGAGLIGSFGLRVVDEEEMIEEAVEELERSGLLEESSFFQRSVLHDGNGYGTLDRPFTAEEEQARQEEAAAKNQDEEEDRKKTWLLNAETRLFLTDPTMWFFMAGFFLATGPCEAFINNFGTMLDTIYPPPSSVPSSNSASTNVSIFAATSTLARLLLGGLSDVFAPTSPMPSVRRPASSSSSSSIFSEPSKQFTISRLTLLLTTTTFLTISFVLLASPLLSTKPMLFPLITAFLGTGYGALFSLTPIIVSVVWGVQNFGTNWGIMATVPAAGAAVWGGVYSAVYEKNAGEDELCWGRGCFETTAWAWVACGVVTMALWVWAWRGRGGWKARHIAV